MHADYPERIATLHRELGIPADYAYARSLSLQPEAKPHALVTLSQNDASRPIQLIQSAAAAWTALCDSARKDQVLLLPLSGFRSVDRQVEIVRRKLADRTTMDRILSVVAAPGHSEHHTGRALDIGTPDEPPLEESFHHTTAFAWLTAHASNHGFHMSYPAANAHGIVYEPWHWCWRPN